MRNLWILAGLTLTLTTACRGADTTQTDIPKPVHMMILADLSTPEEQAYAAQFTDGFTKKARRFETISLDSFSDETTEVHYSGVSSSQVVEEFLVTRLGDDVIPSTDKALLAAAQRVSDYAHDLDGKERLIAVLLTEGTKNKETIDALTTIVETLPSDGSTTVYIAGVSSKYVSSITPVFHTMPANARVIGQFKSDLKTLLRSLH